MKASDLFLKCLEVQGVTTIAGVPGEENADLLMSFKSSSIDFISTRHEQTAAFMAVTHGQLTGRCGVCMGTLGPGATNLLTGVAQANMDHAPLVAIIGQAETSRLHKESHQNMDSVSMYRSVTKWSTTILDASVIPEVIAKAFEIAQSGRPGAVLIELPEDIAKQMTDAQPFRTVPNRLQVGTTKHQIKRVCDALSQAKKPIVLLGDGAVNEACFKEVTDFLSKTNYYAAYTFMGKGAIHHAYERSLHCVGLGFNDLVIEAFQESDCVICVGYHMVEYLPERWNIGNEKTIIHVDVEPAEIDKDYLPDLSLVGEIHTLFQQLNSMLSDECKKSSPYFEKVQNKIQHDLNLDKDDDGFPMKPKRILHDIRDTLDDDGILVSDVGAHKMWVARQYGARLPKTVFISNGFCSMSGSMPGALEAKRLYPKKQVVAVCGDGGFMMGIQALPTGVELGVPFVVIVWQDDYYGLIKWKQQLHYGDCSHVKLDNPDLAKLAEAYGCHGYHIDSSSQFKSVLEEALAQTDKPSVIVVPVDYDENMKLVEHLRNIM